MQQQQQQQQSVGRKTAAQQQQQAAAAASGSQQTPSSSSSSSASGLAHSSHAPSRVLHIRGLPAYTSESDVLSFFSALPGVVLTRILLLPNSNQAFLQMASVEQAQQLVAMQAQQGGSFILKGNKSIIVQFSNRQEIHTPATMAAAAGANGAAGSSSGGGSGAAASSSTTHADYKQSGGGGGGVLGHDSQQNANSILIVTVLNTRVPVTLDHIHQIFKVRATLPLPSKCAFPL